MRQSHFYLLIFMILIMASCLRTPTEPKLITSKELSLIPFEQLSGKIVFKRTLKEQPQQYHFMMLNAEEQTLQSIAIFDAFVPTNLMLSPNADRILFSYYIYKGQTRSFLWQMYVMDIASMTKKNIAPSLYDDSYGSWSPNGRQIAFWSNRFLESSIWLADFDQDSCYYVIEIDQIARSRPAWFSDGKTIVVSNIDENFHPSFYRLELSSGAIQKIYSDGRTNEEVVFKHPMISHNDRFLAFVKSIKAQFDEIWLFDLETRVASQLTTGYFDWHPAWSPDDSKIMFSRGDFLYIVDVNGSSLTRVTFGKHTDEYPSWAP